MSAPDVRIGAIVPAAGRSARMGRSKPLLPLGGTDFLGRILDTLHRSGLGVAPVVVVRRDGDEALAARLEALAAPELRVATVPDDDGDMLRSVRAGASLAADAAGALVWPGDAPAVAVDTVRAVGRAALGEPRRVVQPALDGKPGHPTYVPREILALEGPPPTDGLRGLLAAGSTAPIQVSIEDPYSLLNVNTPAEYEALLRALGG